MKKNYLLLLGIFLFVFSGMARGQIAAWQLYGKLGSEVTIDASTINSNLNTSTLSRGSGLIASALGNSYGSTNFTASGTKADAIANSKFLLFSLNSKTNYAVSLSTLDVRFRRSATGPNAFRWQFTIDGGTNYTDIGSSDISYTLTTTGGDAQTQINLSSIPALQNVSSSTTITLRLLCWGATSTNGTFAIGRSLTNGSTDYSLSIGGTVSSTAPSITLSSPNPSVTAGNIMKGTAKNLIYKFNTAVTTANTTLNSITFTTGGTYSATDVTKYQLWYNTSENFSSATQIGSDITTSLDAGSHIFSLSQNINSGTTGYFYITTDVAVGAVTNNTINVAAITTGNLVFTSGNLTGTAYAGQDQTIIASTTPDIVLASPNPSVSAANIQRGSLKNLVYQFNTAVSTANATLQNLAFTSGGTYVAGDVVKFQLYYNSTDNFAAASQIGSDITTTVGPGAHAFASLTQVINSGATGYFYITADITGSSTPGDAINISAITTGDLTFVAGNKSGTAFAGQSQTIIAPDVALSSTTPAVPAGNILRNSTKQQVYRFVLGVTNGTTKLTQVDFTSGGTYSATDITKFQLWYSTTDNLSGASQIGTDISTSLGIGAHSFTGLITNLTNITGYFWITVDVPITTTNLTFDAANKSGTASAGGDQTIASPTLLLSSLNPSEPAANICQGSIKDSVYKFTLTMTSGQSTLTQINFTTTGVYNPSGDINKFQLWYNNVDNISTATKIGTDIISGLGTGPHSFTGLSQTISTTGYFWITIDVEATASVTNTIQVSAIATSDITLDAGTLTGTAFDGGVQTIIPMVYSYRSAVVSGNWNSPTTWEVSSDLTNWTPATGYPGAVDNVYIQVGHLVTLTKDESCNDLHLNVATNSRLGLASFNLNVNGKLRAFTGAVNVIPGTSSNSLPTTSSWISSTTGKIRIVGTTRTITYTGEWGAGNTGIASPNGFDLEFALTSGNTGTLNTSIKARTITILTGTTINATNYRLAVDMGAATGSNLTINSGATLISNCTGTGTNAVISRTTSGLGDVLTLNGTLILTGTSPTIGMTTINFNGLVEYSGTNQTLVAAINAGANPNVYTDLNIKGTGTKTMGGAITVNGSMTIYSGATFACGTNVIDGSGNFTLSQGGTLNIGSPDGITNSNPLGNIQTKVRNFDARANYTYNGAAAQVTGDGLPANVNNLTINNSSNVTLTNSVNVNGTMALSSGIVIPNSNALTYGASGTLLYNNSVAQTTCDVECPLSSGPYNLTINNPAGVTLHASRTLGGTLTLTSGNLFVGANTLSVGSVSVSNPDNTKMIVLDDGTNIGNLLLGVTSTGMDYLFPVGDTRNTAHYSPVTVNFNTGTTFSSANLGVSLKATKNDYNSSLTNYLNRYWDFTPTGISNLNYNINLYYVAGAPTSGDVSGTESNLHAGKYSGGIWTYLGPVDTANHKLSFNNLTGFSTFTGGEIGAMPVELTSFKSNLTENNVNLNWITANENNNAGFEVMRTVKDANNWTKIGYVKGNGTVSKPSTYTFEDKKLNVGKYQYRLKQIDVNGNYKYYTLNGTVEITPPKEYKISQNYPNPFNPTTKIDYDLPFDSKVKLLIYDITGRELKVIVNEVKTAGYYTAEFNGVNLASGIYFYRILANANGKDFIVTKKMALIK
jgi:hypothetical protein